MFTLNDIKPLVMVEGAKAVIVKVNSNDAELMDESLRKNIGNQIKKATKLPVIFIPNGMDVEILEISKEG